MSIIGFLVVGDRTSHGGAVITGDLTFIVGNQPVARVGDMVSCPRCLRTSTIVSSRFPTVFPDGGAPVAFDQDTTDCGAVIYSRHNGRYGWGAEDTADTTVAPIDDDAPVEDDSSVKRAPAQSPDFQEHFIFRNNKTGEPRAGVPYTITTGEGMTFEGETDEQGRTGVVWTASPQPITVVAHPKVAGNDDPYHYSDTEGGDV